MIRFPVFFLNSTGNILLQRWHILFFHLISCVWYDIVCVCRLHNLYSVLYSTVCSISTLFHHLNKQLSPHLWELNHSIPGVNTVINPRRHKVGLLLGQRRRRCDCFSPYIFSVSLWYIFYPIDSSNAVTKLEQCLEHWPYIAFYRDYICYHGYT